MDPMWGLTVLMVIFAFLTALVIRRVVIWRRLARASPKSRDVLDTPVLAANGEVVLTRRTLNQGGVLITGQTGSGKSSAIINTLVRRFMELGFGLLLVGAKPSDAQAYLRLARRCGRHDVTVLDESANHRLSFMRSLVRVNGSAATRAALAQSGLSGIAEVLGRTGGGGQDETFWKSADQRNVRANVALHLLADVEPTPRSMMRLQNSVPKSGKALKSPEFRRSYCWTLLEAAERNAKASGQVEEFRVLLDYFADELVRLSPRTRSIIEAMQSNTLAPLVSGIGADLLAGEPTFDLAELVASNGILVTDLPLARYQSVGAAVGSAVKMLCQLEVQRRAKADVPFVLVVDEAAAYLTEADAEYVSICRAFQGPMVLALQCVSQLFSLGPGDQGRHRANVLAGNLACKLAAQSTPETAKWLSEICGKERQFFAGGSVQSGGYESPMDLIFRKPSTATGSFQEQLTERLRPEELFTLRTGGPANGNLVDVLVLQPGQPHRYVTLKQEKA